jgi:alkyl hydroperoxide reductase subunit AhpC
MSLLRINDEAPDFTADSTHGLIQFHQWIGDNWAVLFSHPKDFTPVCTTELGALAGLEGEFAKRGAKIIGLSVDPVENHAKWAVDIQDVTGNAVNYPMIGDVDLKVAKLYNMLPADETGTCEGRTPATNAAVRTVFVIGPDKKIKLQLSYPMTTGRNFDEVLRVLDSMQLTAKHQVATPPPTGSRATTSSSPESSPMRKPTRPSRATRPSSPTSARPPNPNNATTGTQTNAFDDGMKRRDVR